MCPHMQYHALAPCYVHITCSTTCVQSPHKQTRDKEMTNLVRVYVPRKTWMSSWMAGWMVGHPWSCKVSACWLMQWSWAGCSNKNAPDPCCNYQFAERCVPSRDALVMQFTWHKLNWERVEQSSTIRAINEEWHDLGKLQRSHFRVRESVTLDTQSMQGLHQSVSRRLQQCIANGGDTVN